MSQSAHEHNQQGPASDERTKETSFNLKEKLTDLAENPEVQNETFKMIESLDNTRFMGAVRNVWDNMPFSFQNVALKLPSVLPQIKLLKGFVRIGLLKPKDPTLSLEDIAKTDAVMEKIALRIAQKIVPEMAVFEETVDPYLQKLGFDEGLEGYLKFQGTLTEDFCTRMRTRLYVSRLQQSIAVANDNSSAEEQTKAA